MKCRPLHLTNKPSRLPPWWAACRHLRLSPLALCSGLALAQEAPAVNIASRISIVPRVSVAETFTNNVLLDNNSKRSELITQISPGIRISSSGGRIQGSVDYSLTELLYANNTTGRQSQNNLNAAGTIKLVDNWASVDFSGTIGQQSISAFGTPSSGGVLAGGNSTETSVFRLSPYLRGRLADVADYDARYSITRSSSAATAVADVNQRDASLLLTGGQARFGLSWGVDAAHQAVSYSAGRSTNSSVLNARLQYALNERWGAYTRVTHESNDFAIANGEQGDFVALGASWTPNPDLRVNLDRDNRGFTGVGINWAPSNRTSVSITRDGRLYGATHSIALAYRPGAGYSVGVFVRPFDWPVRGIRGRHGQA